MQSTRRQKLQRPSAKGHELGISGLDGEAVESGTNSRRMRSARSSGTESFRALVDVAKVIAAAPGPAQALDQLVHLVVPAFGDFAVVVIPRDHQLHVIAAAHKDPAKDVFARLLLGQAPIAPMGESPSTRAFKTGRPIKLVGLSASDLAGWFGDDAYSDWAQSMEIRAVLAMPLKSRGSTVGVMTFGLTNNCDSRRLDPDAIGPLTSLVAIAVQQAADSYACEELKTAFRAGSPARVPGSNSAVEPRSVLIVDPLSVARKGIRALVEDVDSLSICGEAIGLQDACAFTCQPDVIVTGLVLEDCAGPQVVTKLLDAFPAANLLVVSRIDRPLFVHLALACGAKGYMLKSAPLVEVLDAICQVSKGEPYVQPLLGAALSKWQSSLSGRTEGGKLTQREREVLGLVALGHTNAEIASITGVSLRTVETHRSHLVHKLAVHSRADLVARATELTMGAG